MKQYKLIDLRRIGAFPNLSYRFAEVKDLENEVIIERDFLGENPAHYYIDGRAKELIVGSNIIDLKEYLEKKNRNFAWDRVRAVSNNTRLKMNNLDFISALPREEELGETLQDMALKSIDYSDFSLVGKEVRALLESSLEQRLQTVSKGKIGLLLSGGLDSMSIGYLLSKVRANDTLAFTLKLTDQDKDIVKSREMAQRCGIDLVEISMIPIGDKIRLRSEHYDTKRSLIGGKDLGEYSIDSIVSDTLRISGNPKKDNLFCSVGMYLVSKAITSEGISTVFCGEGPNEMINDYGYDPEKLGYGTHDKSDTNFREALTFGLKKNDKQLGRGGLPKHALVRMGKMFGHFGIRLEAPYFDAKIAKIMTHIPHTPSYDTIKQHLMAKVLSDERFDDLIMGTSKEKFQDGSGVSNVFKAYDQAKLIDMFEDIYGIRKTAYL